MQLEANQKDVRLNKRAWLIHNFDYVFKEAVYYRLHKDNISLPGRPVWRWGEELGSCKINYVE